MHWLECTLLVTTLCISLWHYSAALADLSNEVAENTISSDSKENESFHGTEFPVVESTEKLFQDITANLTQKTANNTGKPKSANITASDTNVQISVKSGQKREVENVTFNDIKPFLLFPILPFLFPPRIEENLIPDKDEFSDPKNETSKVDGKREDKPFIFFDFAFFRRIPLNDSLNSNNSKIIDIKKLNVSEEEDPNTNSLKNRRRRNTNSKKNSPGFFDDSPLFPDSELDEFLPKPEMLFRRKPFRKLNRRKRDQKKTDLKDDLKMFFDAVDEAFMRTKREFEKTDPILNFLRGGEPPFGEDKKEDEIPINQLSGVQDKPKFKWRIQRNIKKLNNHPDGVNKGQDGPMIIVDKVVKIGEFHMHDDENDKEKSNKLKKETNLSNGKFLGDGNDDILSNVMEDAFPKNIFDLIRHEENKRKRRHHPEGQTFTKILSKEIKILPQMNSSFLTVGNNATIEVMKETEPNTVNQTKKGFVANLERLKRRGSTYFEKINTKKASYETLKKNVTELLNQFLELAKHLDDMKVMKKLEDSERDEPGAFDWTEKETLQNGNILGKDSKTRRQKKHAESDEDYADLTRKEIQVADLNFLFLTVTLPTVFIFAVALLVCFFSLQVKGKICSRLFKPRQVFIVDDDNSSSQLKSSTGTKTPPKVQPY